MSEVTVTVDVDAAPDDVWEVVADPRNLPRWDRHVTKVVGVPTGGLEVGTEYTTRLTFWGVSAHVEAEVLELDAPKRSRIRLSGPLIQAAVTTRLIPIGEDRTRIEHHVEYRFRGGPLGHLAARALAASGGPSFALRRGTLAQKQQIERG
jgi:uncharacterized protein YndB with AHSA1/START domain